MNFLRSIINLLLKIFGAKVKEEKPSEQKKQEPKKEEHLPEPHEPTTMAGDYPLVPVLRITPEVMKTVLMLGHHDEGIDKEEIRALLTLYHERLTTIQGSIRYRQLRQGDLFRWVDLKPVAGDPVRILQTFLVNAGIMHPTSNRDGIFAYATQAGVRLFQEYVRIYENKKIIPTGIVDQATWTIMKEWQDAEKTAVKWPRGKQSNEYKKWLAMMKKAKAHYQAQPHKILQKVNLTIGELNTGTGPLVDTFKVEDWTFNKEDIHLIGIRRREDIAGRERHNDDVFVLLINGLVFKFWGSTDPKQAANNRRDEAFLSEGQHKFRFGWHNVSNQAKLYQGLNPYQRGVLVFRDDMRSDDDRLTDADIDQGIDKEPNTTINIHWTGIGDRATWSAGCQVIAGMSYIDPLGEQRDCSAFAAVGSADLQGNQEDRITKTKGAYNLFSDLLLVFPAIRIDYLIYTLGRDETLSHDFLTNLDSEQLLADTLKKFDLEQGEGLA